jgi:hypothetical protein
MAAVIVKLEDDAFVEWSTVVDAPVSPTLTKQEAAEQFGVDRVERANANWHSWLNKPPATSAFDVVAFNRAGPNEQCLTPKEIADLYRR